MNAVCLWCAAALMQFGGGGGGAPTPVVETSPVASTRLYVKSIPPGATVVVDGKSLGTAEGLFLLPAGVRKVELKLDGSDPAVKQIELAEGRITRIEVELRPTPTPALGGGGADGGERSSGNPTPAGQAFGGGIMGIGGAPGASSRVCQLKTPLEAAKTPPESSSKLEKTLYETPIELDVQEMPLRDLVDHLAEKYAINTTLNLRDLESDSISIDAPVSIKVSGVRLASALDLLLAPINASWRIQDEAVEITSAGYIEARVRTQVYGVADLTNDPQSLQLLITSVVAPENWDQTGGVGRCEIDTADGAESLVIRHSDSVQRQVAELLRLLRRVSAASEVGRTAPLAMDGYWDESPSTAKVRAALERKTSVDFVGSPLKDVVEFLAISSQMPILLDARGLENTGATGDSPVTLRQKETTVHRVLATLESSLSTSYTVKHEVLLLGAPDEENWTVALYPVGDLVKKGRSLDHLMRITSRTVRSETWVDEGGEGVIRGVDGPQKSLVVRQTAATHRELQLFLDRLRSGRP
ncbi:MAG: PEGA domain-containing protein [Pirellulales bacterium]